MNGKAVSILKELQNRQVILTPWVFSSPVNIQKSRYGNPFTKKIFIPAMEKDELSGVVCHTLRQTFCPRLLQAGIPLTTVQKLAGHKDYSTTLIHAHLSPEHLHDAVRILDKETKRRILNPNRHRKRHHEIFPGMALVLARPEGFEPPTFRFVVYCSIQLSYGRFRGKISGSGTRDLNSGRL